MWSHLNAHFSACSSWCENSAKPQRFSSVAVHVDVPNSNAVHADVPAMSAVHVDVPALSAVHVDVPALSAVHVKLLA